MPVLDQDTAIRANQAGIGTASSGSTYTETGTGAVNIVSNEIVSTSVGSDSNFQLGTLTTTNQDVLVRMSCNNLGDIFGPEGRYSVTGGNITCYKLLYYSGAIHLNKCISGANTQMTSVNITITSGTFYWMRLTIVGTKLQGKMWQDGTQEPAAYQTTTNESTIASGGCAVLVNTTGVSTGVSFDHITFYSYVPQLVCRSRAVFKVLSGQQANARANFLVRQSVLVNARATFYTRTALVTQSRTVFKTTVKMVANARATFKIVAGVTTSLPIGLIKDAIIQLMSLVVSFVSSLNLTVRSLQAINLTYKGRTMAAPNSTIQSSVTVTDSTGALVSNLSALTLKVTFPDATTSTLSIGSGITNVGSGVYTAKYNTKGNGETTELWNATAADGTTIASFQDNFNVGY